MYGIVEIASSFGFSRICRNTQRILQFERTYALTGPVRQWYTSGIGERGCSIALGDPRLFYWTKGGS